VAPGGLVIMLAVGLAMQAAPYFAAPTVALLADRDVRRSAAALADNIDEIDEIDEHQYRTVKAAA